MKLQADLLEAKHWIYPVNRPKRDYQYNIVKNSLFENTLVALPTGLGKTFIAGVVMLNFYRWFPDGKVIFVAPTKPLVSQQIMACHETCGISSADSIELNGSVPAAMRARYWEEKRVFFMTPQTLVNDLVKQNCDARDIVLLVIDEAHRASGDYAYNQAVRYLMAKNPHFRILALTATPGNSVEAVQTLVDGLHISRIEIRNEESLDLKPYIHKKVFKSHIIRPNEDVGKIRDLLVKVMDNYMKPLKAAGLFHAHDSAISMHPYRPQAMMRDLKDPRFYVHLSMLGKLARSMLYLLTGSIETCYTHLIGLTTADEDPQGGKKNNATVKRLKDDASFRTLMLELETQKARGWAVHPKVEKLKQILIQHFGSNLADEGEENTDDTKIMVFSSYREVVREIVRELDKERPLIRATQFVGQGTDKLGHKGLAQKEQLEVIKKFKAGEYNVLVATSIGEEGLDIGEIDMTICYDADKAPTRMIQRFGRTGRKRQGTIHALLAEGREEYNIDKAEATYKEVQKVVNKGEMYELYGDVERLLPDHMKPECVEKVVTIEEYVRKDLKVTSPRKAAGKGTKRKRNDDIARNIPDGASTGFVSVRDLIAKGSKKKKKITLPEDLDAACEDDEDDMDIESGRILNAPRRTQSAAATSSAKEKPATKARLKKASTVGGTKTAKPRAKKAKIKPLTLSQLSEAGKDDSDDMDIESGVILPSTLKALKERERTSQTRRVVMSATPEPSPEPEDMKTQIEDSVLEISDSEPARSSPSPVHEDHNPLSPTRLKDVSTIDLSDSEEGHPSSPAKPGSSPQQDQHVDKNNDQDMSWLVDDDEDDNHNLEIVDSSPLIPKSGTKDVGKSNKIPQPDWGQDIIATSDPLEAAEEDESIEFVEPSDKVKASTALATHPSPMFDLPSSPGYPTEDKDRSAMPPPALPRRLLVSPGDHSSNAPEPSFPVRPLGNQANKKRRIIFDESESPSMEMPPRRIHRMESTPIRTKSKKNKEKTKRAKPSLLDRDVNPLFDGEAAHSGDEVSEGYSEEDEESESDRMFIKNSPATQASPSYDQSLIYRQSLLTQAGQGPAFAKGPARQRPFGRIDRRGHPFLPSSSPPPPDEDLDQYDSSFVVADDAEISYDD
ncbi:hypothetical protein D9613_001611 [Agrocybe pediades]|uniref:ATP-dependent DNA helicase n=1 Tax=Agrocybe pediades TaxID=84607 RepID=A0A8H4R7Y8_9AGAR|nr:hypothetical protein D9613_001611 [Agrocybe pediades]